VWLPNESKLIKVRLQTNGKDVETPWAEDCGPGPGAVGRLAKLGNVPFLHAKPRYEDVICVTLDEQDGFLTWDSLDLPYRRLGERIAKDGGRFAMIVDYSLLDPRGDAQAAFSVLDRAGERANVAVEGCYGPELGKPGRAYLAVPSELKVQAVLTLLAREHLPMTLTVVHPV
jgi:hypothetical protein